MALNAAYVDRSGFKAGNPWLDKAIATCEQGAVAANSAVLQSNAVIYKTIRGDVAPLDWQRLHDRLPGGVMNVQNKSIALILLSNVNRGMALDADGVVKSWELIGERTDFEVDQYLEMAAYAFSRGSAPDKALLFLRRAVELAPPEDPRIAKMFGELEELERGDWLQQLQRIEQGKPVP